MDRLAGIERFLDERAAARRRRRLADDARASRLGSEDGFVRAPTRAEVAVALLRALAFTPIGAVIALSLLEPVLVPLGKALGGPVAIEARVILTVGALILAADLLPKLGTRPARAVRIGVFERGRRLLPLALLAFLVLAYLVPWVILSSPPLRLVVHGALPTSRL